MHKNIFRALEEKHSLDQAFQSARKLLYAATREFEAQLESKLKAALADHKLMPKYVSVEENRDDGHNKPPGFILRISGYCGEAYFCYSEPLLEGSLDDWSAFVKAVARRVFEITREQVEQEIAEKEAEYSSDMEKLKSQLKDLE